MRPAPPALPTLTARPGSSGAPRPAEAARGPSPLRSPVASRPSTTRPRAAAALLLLAASTTACGGSPEPVAAPPRAEARPPVALPSGSPEAAPAPAGPEIVQVGAPVLRGRAAEVPPERVPTAEMRALVARMIDTMRRAPGVGLAAPQIGVPLRVIVLEDRDELIARLTPTERAERERAPFAPRVFVNPVLRPVGAERAAFFEGCLSVKGYVGLVERSAEVEVTGLDERGAPSVWRVRGWPARILQHEVDHLDGTLYVDRMMTRSFATAEQAKALYGGKPIAEIRRLLGL